MKNETLNSEPNTALNIACVKSRFFVGRRLFQHYGNGMRFDTIVKNEKYHIELAGDGSLDKKILTKMVSLADFIINRLYENGDISKQSSKEGN